MRVTYNDYDDRAGLRGYVQFNKYIHTVTPLFMRESNHGIEFFLGFVSCSSIMQIMQIITLHYRLLFAFRVHFLYPTTSDMWCLIDTPAFFVVAVSSFTR